MKQLYFFLLGSILLIAPVNLTGQKINQSETKNYYWFNIKLKSIINPETKKPVLSTDRVYNKIYSGTFNDYSRAYKKNLKKNKITIGLFTDESLPIKVQRIYSQIDLPDDLAERFTESYKDNGEVFYWYFAKPVWGEDKKQLSFERMPARVASGTIKHYIEHMYEGITHGLFAVGPFEDALNAEKSKYIFRKYGELGEKGDETAEKISMELNTMAEKWKSIDIQTLALKLEDSKINIKYSFDFPPEYFEKNAVQAISVAVVEKDTTFNLSEAITLQGLEFKDNNDVVVYENGRKYDYETTISPYSGKSLTLLFRCILLTNSSLFECEDRKVTVEIN